MSKADEKAAREQRLAIKLRENLRRRKGQAKARGDGDKGDIIHKSGVISADKSS
jgi:hypothetical protein